MALVYTVRDRLLDNWVRTLKHLKEEVKAVSYLSQELYPAAPHLESLAQQYADLLRQQEFSRAAVAAEAAQWETVVIDAGLASTANLAAIQAAGFSYIAVSRSRPQEMPASGMVVIKETNATTIQVQRLNQDGEVIPGYPAQISEKQTTAGLTPNVVTRNFLQST